MFGPRLLQRPIARVYRLEERIRRSSMRRQIRDMREASLSQDEATVLEREDLFNKEDYMMVESLGGPGEIGIITVDSRKKSCCTPFEKQDSEAEERGKRSESPTNLKTERSSMCRSREQGTLKMPIRPDRQ